MTAPGGPLKPEEVRQIITAVAGEPISIIVFVTADLRLATFPQFHPNERTPTMSAFLRQLADSLDEAEANGLKPVEQTFPVPPV